MWMVKPYVVREVTIDLPNGRFYTIAGIQKETGLCRNTVRKLIIERKIDARDFCGLTIIPDASLQNYFNNLPMASLAGKAVIDAAASSGCVCSRTAVIATVKIRDTCI